jgi:transcriptional regulator with XRE-family HTH domain
MSTTIGNKIRVLRKEKGYTLDELAVKADSSKSYIWELENKNPPRPSAEKLAKIAKALGVTLDYFVDDEVPEEDARDAMFYREYRKKDPETKKKIRDLIDLMWKDEK